LAVIRKEGHGSFLRTLAYHCVMLRPYSLRKKTKAEVHWYFPSLSTM
jgi:hypothetical protein